MARAAPADWVQRIDALLPQTQCTRCGEPDCASYARAVAAGAPINRCPPGGAAGVQRLAALTGEPARPLDPAHGQEGPRHRVWIDEALCIGCTLCIKACPVDAIVGAAKRMHSVLDAACTGCELCIPACPVDCIHLEVATPGRSGWAAWSSEQAEQARARYLRHQARLAREQAHEARRLAARSARAKPPAAALPASGDLQPGPTTAAPPGPDERMATADSVAPASTTDAQKHARIGAALERARALRAG